MTEEEYEKNVQQLKQSSEWREDATLQTWLERKWLPQRDVSCMLQTLPVILSLCAH